MGRRNGKEIKMAV